MVPVEALDGLLMSLFASLASPRAIFLRRHVLAPGLRLAVVMLLIGFHASVMFLAFGYLAASVFGVALYVVVFLRHLRSEGLFKDFSPGDIRLPCRELFGFMLPMMTSDLMPILNESVVVLLLGYFHGLRDVALYRVVMPVAALNHLVGLTSGMLYMPAAARLFASGDRQGLSHLYWRSAAWVAVLSFPVFVATFAFARPLTLALFGGRYAESGTILAIVAAGYYFEVMWGFNGMTLKALNKARYVVGCNVITAAVNIVLTLTLVPRYGALGAAIATACSMAFIAVLRQVALKLAAGIDTMNLQVLGFYAMITLSGALLLVVRSALGSHLYLACMVAFGSMLAVLLFTRKHLQVSEMFPESARIPWMRRFFAQ
jgi:O-antigen/teichoic acid export membrane protein